MYKIQNENILRNKDRMEGIKFERRARNKTYFGDFI